MAGTQNVDGTLLFTQRPDPIPVIYYTLTVIPSQTATPQPPTPSPEGICGQPLDVYFGTEHIFVIHQAQNGDSLNMYVNTYQTSVDAIQAVNFRLPIPLQAKWVLVIPVGETQVENLPAFEPYSVSLTDSSIAELAGQFSTDPTAFAQYNAFDENCRAFSGWVLIPRQKSSP